uniref:Very-long-chain (3R)-3-hydroxyacyl-CoA dehydratase n=1 Tax=Gallus gallus TaxID=9031 RepID=A0A8V0Z852_CHICK
MSSFFVPTVYRIWAEGTQTAENSHHASVGWGGCCIKNCVHSLEFIVQVQTEDSVLLFVVAWTITEIIRYSFYTFSLLNHLPYLIKWARYTLFIILYPMGVSGELLTIYAALPFVRQSGLYSISLPNKYNFSFDYYTFLILVMISYIPLFPQLYFHMLRQRRKVLSHTEEHKKSE